MTTLPVVNYKRTFVQNKQSFDLNITARNIDGFPPHIQTMMIVRTVNAWLYLARAIQNGLHELDEKFAMRTVESSIEEDCSDEVGGFVDYGESRVTVFDWNHQIDLTMHSHSLPQPTLDLYWAMFDAKAELAKLYPPQTSQDGSSQGATPAQGTNTPPSPANPVEGVIVATKAPAPNNPQYADGQLVSYTINKIAAGSNQGSATFALWGPLGQKYPIITVYKTNKNGESKKDFQEMLPVLNALKLDFEHPEGTGNWRLVARASHAEKDGKDKEYMNLVSLTPI